MRPFTAGRYKSTLNLPLTARVMLGGDTAEGLACPTPTSAGGSPCPYSRTSSFWLFSWLSGAAHVHLGQEKQMGCSGSAQKRDGQGSGRAAPVLQWMMLRERRDKRQGEVPQVPRWLGGTAQNRTLLSPRPPNYTATQMLHDSSFVWALLPVPGGLH